MYRYVLDDQLWRVRAYPRKDAKWPKAPDQEGQNHFHLREGAAHGPNCFNYVEGFQSHGGTPKSSNLMGFSIVNHHLGDFPSMETPIWGFP